MARRLVLHKDRRFRFHSVGYFPPERNQTLFQVNVPIQVKSGRHNHQVRSAEIAPLLLEKVNSLLLGMIGQCFRSLGRLWPRN